MEKFILAGVGTMTAYTQSTTNPIKIFTSKTLVNEGLNISVTAEDVRGGLSNPLLGQYFHDALLNLTAEDALFSLQYLALNVGGNITVGGNSIERESFTVTTPNQITVKGTPVAFGNAGTVGWYTISGADDWKTITFEGKVATVPNLPAGTEVCVEYNAHDDAARQFIVPSAMIPSEVYVRLTFPLFKAQSGSNGNNIATSSKVGELNVDVPRFLFSGSQDLALTSSGTATTSLSGTALATYTTTNCDDMGAYGTITQKIYGAVWSDNLVTMAVDGADVQIKTTEETTLKVFGIYSDNAVGAINNANLTFTTEASAFTVNNEGVVKGVSEGKGTVKIVATPTAGSTNPIECYAEVTVS